MRTAVQTKEVRDAILDATDMLLARYGYKKMTIDDIANEVGIGKGSVYLHFSSKEEIALSHVDRIIERLCDKLSAIAEQNISTEKRIEKMIVTRVTFRFESVQHYTQSLNDLLSSLRENLLSRRKKYHDAEAKIIASVIKSGQKSGDFRSGNALQLANSFLLATNSLLPFNLSTKELGKREDIEKSARNLTRLLLRGIKK
ncbi:MAG: TetR/AcrR family transcriptional regulator [Pyrinomonadaceae bacterium]|nr:TetR/AcrR family transcriptional regulator [Pyrinomonadaceae bacterium]